MPLEDIEGPNKFPNDLNEQWPLGTDLQDAGDNHIRGVKNIIRNTLQTVAGTVLDGPLHQFFQPVLPIGTILPFAGQESDIPEGWFICDGENGTPDLQATFLRGHSDTANPGDTGGANTVQISEAQLPSHTHGGGSLTTSVAGGHDHGLRVQNAGQGGTNTPSVRTGGSLQDNYTEFTGQHSHNVSGTSGATGDGANFNNQPAYYVVYFIMRVS